MFISTLDPKLLQEVRAIGSATGLQQKTPAQRLAEWRAANEGKLPTEDLNQKLFDSPKYVEDAGLRHAMIFYAGDPERQERIALVIAVDNPDLAIPVSSDERFSTLSVTTPGTGKGYNFLQDHKDKEKKFSIIVPKQGNNVLDVTKLTHKNSLRLSIEKGPARIKTSADTIADIDATLSKSISLAVDGKTAGTLDIEVETAPGGVILKSAKGLVIHAGSKPIEVVITEPTSGLSRTVKITDDTGALVGNIADIKSRLAHPADAAEKPSQEPAATLPTSLPAKPQKGSSR